MVESGSVLREARRRAGLTQVELASRAGVTQSVVSAYESGSRQPSVPTLERLIAATGFELDLRLHRRLRRGPLGRRLSRHRQQVQQMAASHGLTNLRVFGSVVRGLEGPNSDIDLLVDVAPGVGLLELGRCQAELESLLGARIDLVPASDLKPAVRAEALCEAKAL